eukprot:6080874-Alexandrium_andersonii.AAC.1
MSSSVNQWHLGIGGLRSGQTSRAGCAAVIDWAPATLRAAELLCVGLGGLLVTLLVAQPKASEGRASKMVVRVISFGSHGI